jgi:hypothetical protein
MKNAIPPEQMSASAAPPEKNFENLEKYFC